MASLASFLGLNPGATNKVPSYLIWNFIYAYGILSSRGIKVLLKLDHNVAPREDVAKYGERAVKSGKITEAQLAFVKRNEAAHANRVEHFAMFAASTVLAASTGVPNEVVNKACLVYTLLSLSYGAVYLLITNPALSYLRSVLWWGGNATCFYLLSQAGKKLNSS
ncbi:hypothetical protein DV736_g4793, partial [Chaetothyriales sp. CBS 134916]